MDYDKYIDLILAGKMEEAEQYRYSCVPDTLYKYFWLDDNVKKNDQRLSTLEEGNVYLSTLDQFNDPFEGKMFIFDENELNQKGYKKETFEYFIQLLNNSRRICCFANPEEKQQNMPMWAYYANNHQGFCVEYAIVDRQKKYIYPVSYDENRVSGNALVGNLINGIYDMLKNNETADKMPNDISAYNQMVYMSLTCKHRSWQHEKEYRAIVPKDFGIYFPSLPKKIYIGMNCSDENKKRLTEIAIKFPWCELYQMERAYDGLDFKLSEQRVL